MAVFINVGESKNLGVKGAQDSDFTYVSNDPSVATVDADGVVTGVSDGTVTVTLTRKSDSKKRKIVIKVTDPVVVATKFVVTVDNRDYAMGNSFRHLLGGTAPEPEPQIVFSNLTVAFDPWMPQVTYQWGTNQSVSGPWDLRLAAAYIEGTYEGLVSNVTTAADTIHTHSETMTIPYGEYYVEVKLSSSDTWTRGTDIIMIQPQGGM